MEAMMEAMMELMMELMMAETMILTMKEEVSNPNLSYLPFHYILCP
jgi:hypothetical protein